MNAVVFTGTEVRVESARPEPPAPAAGSGEAVVRLLRAGLTSIDREIVHGRLPFTGVLGHEFVGVVEQIDSVDPRDLAGRRVVGAIVCACRQCDMCQGGLSHHCRSRTMLGMRGRDGCLAERFAIPAVNLVPVPDSVDDDAAVFAHPLAAAVQTARQLTIEGKPYITVLGDGPLGLLTVQVMARLNASVRLIGRHPEKFGLCEKWGIKHRHIDEIGRRADQDIVVDCTGAPAGLADAMRLVRPHGTIVLKSLCPVTEGAAPAIDLTPLVFNELTLLGSAPGGHVGPVREAVTMLAEGSVHVINLISKRARFSDVPALLHGDRMGAMLRVLVYPA